MGNRRRSPAPGQQTAAATGWLLHGAEEAAKEEEFAEMVGVVVGEEEDFAEDGLAGAMRRAA